MRNILCLYEKLSDTFFQEVAFHNVFWGSQNHWPRCPKFSCYKISFQDLFFFFFIKRIHNTKPQALALAAEFMEVIALGDLLFSNFVVSTGLF